MAACLVALPLEASAFECIPVRGTNLTQAWTQRCIPYWIDAFSPDLLEDETEALIRDSFDVWASPACTDLSFVFAGPTFERAGFDVRSDRNRNVVMVTRSQSEAAELLMDPALLAITLTSASDTTGEIFDADIILNTGIFQFEDVDSVFECRTRDDPPFDLRNTLVHEVGHLIGFDHSPDIESTMFARADACEIDKRDLTDGDLAGLCSVYPVAAPTQTCRPPASYNSGGVLERFRNQCEGIDEIDSSGCSCVESLSAPSDATPSVAVVVFLLAALRRLAWDRKRPTGR